ncbi:MAG: 6-bladed beta-propeller [Gemmatimonadota bacterium]|nr:6-bladed beta-propeller [Gemmatimonadota bacterium]
MIRCHSAFRAAVVVAITVSACDRAPRDESDSAEAPGFTAGDSAGVEIVENHAPEHPAGSFWTIDSEPEFVLGGSEDPSTLADDSAQLIWRVVGLARLPDGRVAVLSSENQQLMLFEPSGELSRIIGRAGEGPGEFTRPERLQYLPPDTLVVWDYHMTSIDYFDTAGTLLKERSVDYLRLREHDLWGESFRFPLSDGSFVSSKAAQESEAEPPWSDCSPTRRWMMRGSAATGELIGEAREREDPADEFLRIDTSYAAHSFRCSRIIAAGGDPPSIYISRGDRNEIHQFSADGALLRIIRRTTDPIPVTDKARRAWEDRYRKSYESLGFSLPEGQLEAMRSVQTYPPIDGLLVDAEGYLWVSEYSDSETWHPDQWSIFGPDGRWLGVLAQEAPVFFVCRGFHFVCWIDRDFLLVVARDQFDVERVEAYRIRRGG